jgi:glucose/arabinose dehydrogenase
MMILTKTHQMHRILLAYFVVLATFACSSSFYVFAQVPRLGLDRILTLGIPIPNISTAQYVDLENCGDGRLFAVRKQGTIEIVMPDGVLNRIPFLNISSKVLSSGGEQGLLGIAFHPSYPDTPYFYVNYTRRPDGATVIARYTLNPTNRNQAIENSELILLTIAQDYANHNGGCIKFSPKDGYLYIGMGDGGSRNDPLNRALDKKSLLGKMLRIDVNKQSGGKNYSIPPTNPFINDNSFSPEIWAWGLRNPWRFSFDKVTSDLWIADVGQDRWEEIDFQSANSTGGENYGWSCFEGNQTLIPNRCTGVNQTPPVYVYPRSLGVSVTGGFVYRGEMYPRLNGNYLFVDFGTGFFFNTRKVDSGFVTVFDSLVSGSKKNVYSSFGQDKDGEVYVLEIGGTVLRMIDSNCTRTALTFTLPDTLSISSTAIPLTAQPSGGRFEGEGVINQQGQFFFNPTSLDTGDTYITYKFRDGNDCGNKLTKRIRITPRITSINEDVEPKFSIAPNPVNSELTIFTMANSTISLYSVTGEKVAKYSLEQGLNTIQLSPSIPSGMYMLSDGIHNKSIMIVR